MKDIFVISKDGEKQSIIANLATSIALKQAGLDVVLMFTQEAMVALAAENFEFRGLLEGYSGVIEKTITEMGFPAEPLKLLEMACSLGIRVITCPIWARVAESKNEIPSGIEIVEMEELFGFISRADKIMGSF